MKLIIDPHGDDVALFAAFTALREKPLVVVVFDSYVQPSRGIPGTDWQTRRAETDDACDALGVGVLYLGYRDDDPPSPQDLAIALVHVAHKENATEVWAPANEPDGHDQHNLVAYASGAIPAVVDRYLTYTRTGGKSTSANKVPILDPSWIGKKLKALACYESQFQMATGCAPHFLRGIEEYYR